MPLSCHSAIDRIRGETDVTITLAGNPNVGKSSVFNSLTGLGVDTANYPGKTVELNLGTTRLGDQRIGVIDLPGTYALGAVSEDQWVARQGVLDGDPDVVVMVVDATNLARNLYMVLQFIELGYPMVIALNVLDVAHREGRRIDMDALAERLGVPVVPTVANRGEGLKELVQKAVEVAHAGQRPQPRKMVFGADIESVAAVLADAIAAAGLEDPYNLPHRALALLLLENDSEFIELTAELDGWDVIQELAQRLRQRIEEEHGEPAALRIASERHGLAGLIASEVETREAHKPPMGERLWRYTTAPLTGVPILIAVLTTVFAVLFVIGTRLGELMGNAWGDYVSPLIESAIFGTIGDNVVGKSLLWGFDGGIEAALTVGIPFVLTFYLLLAVLEDTGYLNSLAFLTDSVMHKFGLHGRATIPIVAGAGCNVPAIIGTRVLTSMRERMLAGVLIVLVPCSARTAVIFGAVGVYAGWQPAMALYAVIFAVWVATGFTLNKIIPGRPAGLVMEMFPFRRPHLATILKKTWFRFKAFVYMAAPIIIIGSIILGALFETGWLWDLAAPLSPVVEGWMGLPAVTGLALIVAVLRKELALQLLITLAIIAYGSDAEDLLVFMDKRQLFVYALVTAIYIPCVATIAVLAKELGWRRSLGIMAFTVVLAVLIGGLANQLLLAVGWGG